MSALRDREVLLIVGGGIAAYKSAVIARELLRRGARVETVLTEAAARFIGAVTFAGITSKTPHQNLWNESFPGELHVSLASKADAILVAPATADLLARMAAGIADDLATTTLLCAKSSVYVAPAMHSRMYDHAATQQSLHTLRERGVHIIGPATGALASGEVGIGRMEEPEALVDALEASFSRAHRPLDLQGVRVLVSAGPTHEALDPVRFVGNRSSGKMGIAIADAALSRGATVTLVHGPIHLRAKSGVRHVSVRSALEMQSAIEQEKAQHDAIVMAAAVADYRPVEVAAEKIKKSDGELVIRLTKNPDILSGLGQARGDGKRPVLVGFAVETQKLVEYARSKLQRKGCDLVVANLAENGFEGDDNVVTLVTKDDAIELGRRPKTEVAEAILDRVRALLS